MPSFIKMKRMQIETSLKIPKKIRAMPTRIIGMMQAHIQIFTKSRNSSNQPKTISLTKMFRGRRVMIKSPNFKFKYTRRLFNICL